MLYDRWREVAAARRGERALRDARSGRTWTFAELWAAGERLSAPPAEVVAPQGMGAEFILEVLRGWRHDRPVCPLEPDQRLARLPSPPAGMAQWKLTSATTGQAKLVLFTAEQLAADARNIVATMRLRPEWPNLGAISLAHSYGFSNLVLPLLLHGIPLVLVGASLPEAVRRAALGENALTLAGVPALWRAWHEADALPDSLRLALSAGAPLPLPLEHEIAITRGLKIHNFYGSTECGGIAFDRAETPRTDGAFAGTPMEHVQVGLGEDGCLEVRGENVGTGYWPETDGALGGGVFRTRDLAEVTSAGVWLRGRAGDVIHVAGRKVAPEEIERVLLRHPRVRECLVLGLPDARTGREEAIAAVVTVAAGEGADPEDLRQFAAAALPAWQVPRIWHFVGSLETSGRGKVSRAAWRQRLA